MARRAVYSCLIVALLVASAVAIVRPPFAHRSNKASSRAEFTGKDVALLQTELQTKIEPVTITLTVVGLVIAVTNAALKLYVSHWQAKSISQTLQMQADVHKHMAATLQRFEALQAELLKLGAKQSAATEALSKKADAASKLGLSAEAAIVAFSRDISAGVSNPKFQARLKAILDDCTSPSGQINELKLVEDLGAALQELLEPGSGASQVAAIAGASKNAADASPGAKQIKEIQSAASSALKSGAKKAAIGIIVPRVITTAVIQLLPAAAQAVLSQALPIFGLVTGSIQFCSGTWSAFKIYKRCKRLAASYEASKRMFMKDTDYLFCKFLRSQHSTLSGKKKATEEAFAKLDSATKQTVEADFRAYVQPIDEAINLVKSEFQTRCAPFASIPPQPKTIREVWGSDFYERTGSPQETPDPNTRRVDLYLGKGFYKQQLSFVTVDANTPDTAPDRSSASWYHGSNRVYAPVTSLEQMYLYKGKWKVDWDQFWFDSSDSLGNQGIFGTAPSLPIMIGRSYNRRRDTVVEFRKFCSQFPDARRRTAMQHKMCEDISFVKQAIPDLRVATTSNEVRDLAPFPFPEPFDLMKDTSKLASRLLLLSSRAPGAPLVDIKVGAPAGDAESQGWYPVPHFIHECNNGCPRKARTIDLFVRKDYGILPLEQPEPSGNVGAADVVFGTADMKAAAPKVAPSKQFEDRASQSLASMQNSCPLNVQQNEDEDSPAEDETDKGNVAEPVFPPAPSLAGSSGAPTPSASASPQQAKQSQSQKNTQKGKKKSSALVELRSRRRAAMTRRSTDPNDPPFFRNLPRKWIEKRQAKGGTLIFGHRGCFQAAQENTMEGFRAAQRLGADGVEFDTVMDLDGMLWIYHDQFADSLLGVVQEGSDQLLPAPKKMIWDMRTQEVEQLRYKKTLDYSSPSKPMLKEYSGTPKLAKFEDILDFAKNSGLLLDIELKKKGDPEAKDDPAQPDPQVVLFAHKVADMIKAKGMADQVVVTSFSQPPLDALKQRAPELIRGFGYDDYFPKTKIAGFVPFDAGAKIGKANQFYQYGKNKDPKVCEKILAGTASKNVNAMSAFWIKAIDKLMLGKYNDVVALKLPTISRSIVQWFHEKGTPTGAYTAFPIDQRWNQRWRMTPLTEEEEARVLTALFEIGIDWVESDNAPLAARVRDQWVAAKKDKRPGDLVVDIPDLEELKRSIPHLDVLRADEVNMLMNSLGLPEKDREDMFTCKMSKDGLPKDLAASSGQSKDEQPKTSGQKRRQRSASSSSQRSQHSS